MDEDDIESIQWSAPSHLPIERSNDWYWALGLIALFGSIAAILWGNVLFAAIIVLAAMSLGTIVARGPRECEIHVNEHGVTIDHDFYPYDGIRSFWISTEHSAVPKLFITTTGVLHPHIGVILPDPAEPELLHSYLSRHIPEEPGHSLGSWIAEVLGL